MECCDGIFEIFVTFEFAKKAKLHSFNLVKIDTVLCTRGLLDLKR